MARFRLPILLGAVVVMLAGVAGGLALLQTRSPEPADLTMRVPVAVPAAPALPLDPPVAAAVTSPAQTPVPAPAPAQTPSPLLALLEELNTALPRLGVKPPARLTAATVEGSLLVLTFSAEFRPHLANRSALDELTAALSSRVQTHGYRNLDLRLVDSLGRVRSIAELVTTPPARRPRPEPIDDGVRR